MLRTFPHLTSSTAHTSVLGATVNLASWGFFEWRSLVEIHQVTLAVWVGATNFHCLQIPIAVLPPLINNLCWVFALRTNARASILMNGGSA
jgi:hypothetical protein